MTESAAVCCSKCAAYLFPVKAAMAAPVTPTTASSTTKRTATDDDPVCPACLGLWQHDNTLTARLSTAIAAAAAPYVTRSGNRFAGRRGQADDATHNSSPAVILPGDVVRRYQALASANNPQADPSLTPWVTALKEHAKDCLSASLDALEQEWASSSTADDSDLDEGRLGVHIFLLPRPDVVRPPEACVDPPAQRRKRRLPAGQEGASQGGDPRLNLALRLRHTHGRHVWTLNQALASSSSSSSTGGDEALRQPLSTPTTNDDNVDQAVLEIHVAVWRTAFYVRSEYTKIRRDVSQTPFFVDDNRGKRRRLGISSVEEEILPGLMQSSGGISTLNHDPTSATTLFGMAKFHASGREDMDVRMFFPETSSGVDSQAAVTGRPFVCEVTDAYRLPSKSDLAALVQAINHTGPEDAPLDAQNWYGKNPNGVGIAPHLAFVPSASFKNLQADTEDKVKHYGCLCWSQDPLPENEADLLAKLGDYPLPIEQRTPLRVLHRRSNLIRQRNVLTCRVRKIDDHYFRLFISTDAGTCKLESIEEGACVRGQGLLLVSHFLFRVAFADVKEFVHGDLGRSKPSLASIFGCRTDILELDCEGIQSG
jgi:tRNA U54 and U55 pseudouridine synthase Pus10